MSYKGNEEDYFRCIHAHWHGWPDQNETLLDIMNGPKDEFSSRIFYETRKMNTDIDVDKCEALSKAFLAWHDACIVIPGTCKSEVKDVQSQVISYLFFLGSFDYLARKFNCTDLEFYENAISMLTTTLEADDEIARFLSLKFNAIIDSFALAKEIIGQGGRAVQQWMNKENPGAPAAYSILVEKWRRMEHMDVLNELLVFLNKCDKDDEGDPVTVL